jgi:hypothetical protein
MAIVDGQVGVGAQVDEGVRDIVLVLYHGANIGEADDCHVLCQGVADGQTRCLRDVSNSIELLLVEPAESLGAVLIPAGQAAALEIVVDVVDASHYRSVLWSAFLLQSNIDTN